MLREQLAWLVLAGLGATATHAQTVDEVVARHIAARGGTERLEAIRSVRMTGTAGGLAGPVALVLREIERPGRIRTELTFQGITAVYACDGTRGWQVSPFDGSLEPQPMSEERTQLAREQADIDGPLVGWKAKGLSVTLAGRQAIGVREAYVLDVTLGGGSVRRIFIDAQSYLLVRTESTRKVRGHAVTLETTLGDHRAVDGVVFPHSIETGVSGRPARLTVAVRTIELNPVLDDARFRMPEAMAR
jgi:hypothetical protein